MDRAVGGKGVSTGRSAPIGHQKLVGDEGDNVLTGGIGNDSLDGRGGNDRLTGAAGNDQIDGGSGYDTAIYRGELAGFDIKIQPNVVTVKDRNRADGDEGNDVLRNVEEARFGDFTIRIDGTNNGPLTRPDAVTTDEDTAVISGDVLANDFDFEGDAFVLTGASSAAGAVVTIDGNRIVYDPDSLFQGLAAGESATDIVTYTVTDARGAIGSGTLEVTIEGRDEPRPDLDLVVANWQNQPNYWLANDGSGLFGSPTALPTLVSGNYSPAISVGDADGDGDLDLFVANDGGRANLLLANDGRGTFTAVELPGGALNSREIALGDLDGDGDLDALVANTGSGAQFLRNTGAEPGGSEGAFRLDQTLPSLASGGIDNNAYAVALGDLDGDGDLDAVFGTGLFGSEGQAGTRIAINQGGSTPFALDPQAFAGGSTRDVTIADVDLDSDLDILVANDRYQQSYVLLNQGSDGGGFVEFSPVALTVAGPTRSFGISLGDVDADGDMDAFIANRNEGLTPSDLLLLNKGLDGVGNWLGFERISLNSSNNDSRSFALGDIDGDGDVDAILSNQSFGGNEAYLNQGGRGTEWAGFATPYPVTTTMSSEDVALGDLDGDGQLPAVGPDGLAVLVADSSLLPSLYPTS